MCYFCRLPLGDQYFQILYMTMTFSFCKHCYTSLGHRYLREWVIEEVEWNNWDGTIRHKTVDWKREGF